MKRLIRWAFRFILLLAFLIAILLLLKDSILRSVAEKRIRTQTGMDTTIESFHVGATEPVIHIRNLRIYNPPGFDNSRFVDIPEIFVEYDPAALASGKLHFKLVRFNVADVSIVENSDGKTNLEYLQQRAESVSGGMPARSPLEFTGIDTLKLTFRRVRFSSFKHPDRAAEVNLDLVNVELKNVKSAADLSGLIAQMKLKDGGKILGNFTNFSAGAAGANVQKALESLPSPGIKK